MCFDPVSNVETLKIKVNSRQLYSLLRNHKAPRKNIQYLWQVVTQMFHVWNISNMNGIRFMVNVGIFHRWILWEYQHPLGDSFSSVKFCFSPASRRPVHITFFMKQFGDSGGFLEIKHRRTYSFHLLLVNI